MTQEEIERWIYKGRKEYNKRRDKDKRRYLDGTRMYNDVAGEGNNNNTKVGLYWRITKAAKSRWRLAQVLREWEGDREEFEEKLPTIMEDGESELVNREVAVEDESDEEDEG